MGQSESESRCGWGGPCASTSRRLRLGSRRGRGLARIVSTLAPLATFAVLFLAVGSASAQTREDPAPAESLGIADTNRASAWGPAAIYANPAGLLRVPVLVVEAAYSYLAGKDGHNVGVSVVDARTNPDVALGVGYSYFTTRPDGSDRDGSQMRLAVSTGYRSDAVALYAGLGVRWLGLVLGNDDTDEGVEETDDIDTWTGDLGLILEVDHKIRFGVVGTNLIDTKTAEAPRGLGLGLSFVFGNLDVGATLDMDLSGRQDSVVSTWGLGADLAVAAPVHLRAGFIRDERYDAERITFGLGWAADQVAIDLAYATSLTKPTATTFAVSVRWTP